MLNKRLVVWILVISAVLLNVVNVRASTELIRATYGGYVEVVGGEVVLHRRGDELSYWVGDGVVDVAADGEYIYALHAGGRLERVSIGSGGIEIIPGQWQGLITTTKGVIGLQRKRVYDREKIEVKFLSPGHGGALSEAFIPLGDVKYLGELEGNVILRVVPATLVPLASTNSEVNLYYRISENGMTEIKISNDIQHIWGERCVTDEGIGSVGYDKGEEMICAEVEAWPRYITWAGYGYMMDVVGNVIDWHTGDVVASGVRKLEDANGGGLVLKDSDGNLFAISDQTVPPIVGKSGDEVVGDRAIHWVGVTPDKVKVEISEEGGITATGYLSVYRLGEESSNKAEGAGIEAIGVVPVDYSGGLGVYMAMDEVTSSVKYVSVAELEWIGNGVVIGSVDQSGSLRVPREKLPVRRVRDSGEVTVERVLWPESGNNISPIGLQLYTTLSTATHGPEDTIDMFYIEVPISVGPSTATLRIPIGIGMPWVSIRGSDWQDSTLGLSEHPMYLGYSLQLSAHNLWMVIEEICNEVGTATVEVAGGIVASCGVPPYFNVSEVQIDFWNEDLVGSWDKTFLANSNGMYWIRTVGDGADNFPKSSLTTLGKLFIAGIGYAVGVAVNVATMQLPMGWNIAISIVSGPLISLIVDEMIRVADAVSWATYYGYYKTVTIRRRPSLLSFLNAKFDRIMLDTMANYYAAYDEGGDFAGYHEFILEPFSQPTATDRWRHWMLKMYPANSALEAAWNSVQNNEDLDWRIKRDVKKVLDKYAANGVVAGMLTYAKVNPFDIEEQDFDRFMANMRISFEGVITFYGAEADGMISEIRVAVGGIEEKERYRRYNAMVDILNDPGWYAESPETAMIGGIYSTRDETLWNLRKVFRGGPELKRALGDTKGTTDGRQLLVWPAVEEDSVSLVRVGGYDVESILRRKEYGMFIGCYGQWTPTAMLVIRRPFEWKRTVEGTGEVDAMGVWVAREDRYDVGLDELAPELYNLFCPENVWSCCLGVGPGFILRKFTIDGVGLLELPVFKLGGYFPFAGIADVKYVPVIWVGDKLEIMDDNPMVLWEMMPYGSGSGVNSDGSDSGGSRNELIIGDPNEFHGFAYNDSSGLGHIVDLVHENSCEVGGEIVGVDNGNEFWVWNGGLHQLAKYQLTSSTCEYVEVPSEQLPGWISGYDWSDVKGVWVGNDGGDLTILKDGEVEIVDYFSGEVLSTLEVGVEIPEGVYLIEKDYHSSASGFWKLILIVYGDRESIGDDAKLYTGLLKDAYMIEASGAGLPQLEETATGYLRGIYVMPDIEGVRLRLIYRNRIWEWPKEIDEVHVQGEIFGGR